MRTRPMLKRLLSLFTRSESTPADQPATTERANSPESESPRPPGRPRSRSRRRRGPRDDQSELALGDAPASHSASPARSKPPATPRAQTPPPAPRPERAGAVMAPPAAAPARTANATIGERPPHFVLIDTPAGLAPLYAALDRVDEVAMDTEADNMFHYRTRVCLLQFLVDGEVYLVDLVSPLPLEPLWERLAQKHLIMHGSDFDIRLLHDLCRFRPRSIFDTMLAAQLLNRPRVGLGALLEQHFGLQLDKSGQKANWSKRPITPKLLDYAALDVWHLPALRDLLTRELAALDRLDWLDQQCRRQIESGLTGFPRDEENSWRVGPADRLRGRGLSVLHAVWHWREKWAEELDTPPFKVCNNDLLVNIASATEQGDSAEAVLAQVFLGKRQDRLLPSLATAVRQGLERDPTTLPRRARTERIHLSQAEIERQDRIKAYRDAVAARIDLDPTLIAPRSTLVSLCRDPASLDEILLPWQADLLRDSPDLQASPATEPAS
ncbi:MAG: HRDC domain-containing protein [Verrucomicrobia bacterium]|nr:HRDC domain-containing protein [Verrucomicrobiota bacterium]